MGRVDAEEEKKFDDICVGISFTLFFFMTVLSPAIPEESGQSVCLSQPGSGEGSVLPPRLHLPLCLGFNL